MRYEFVHKRHSDWSFEEQKVINDTLAFISQPVAGNLVTETGRFLARLTGVKYLMIGRVLFPEKEFVRTVCFFEHGKRVPDITYRLEHTPCHGVFNHEVCYYPFGVQQEFPKDTDLVQMGVTSYMGTALNDHFGNPIGIIVLLHDKTIENPGLIEHLLTTVSPALEEILAT